MSVIEQAEKRELCFAVLAVDDRQLSPEAKYFLIRVIWLFGDAVVSATVKELAKLLGLTDVAICKARTQLATLGYLRLLPMLDSNPERLKRGRPRQAFMVLQERIRQENDDNVSSRTPSASVGEVSHLALLDKLLFWSVGDDSFRSRNVRKTRKLDGAASRKHTFTVATRILLSVLYLCADACGVVRGLSLQRLSRLVGISSDRLESQLEVISGLGYLIDRVSGLTGRVLYGRATGAFFMNVGTVDLQGTGNGYSLICIKSDSPNAYNYHYWGFSVYLESEASRGKIIFDRRLAESRPSSLASLLKNWELGREAAEFVAEIDWSGCSSDLLQTVRVFLESKGLYYSTSTPFYISGADLFSGGCTEVVLLWAKTFLPFRLWEFFTDRPILGFSKYLQFLVDSYASKILSSSWSQIFVERLVIIDSVLEDLESALLPHPRLNDDPEVIRGSALALFVYCIAYQQAIMVKSIIEKSIVASGEPDSELSSCSYAILPTRQPITGHFQELTIAIRGGTGSRFSGVQCVNRNQVPLGFEKYSYELSPDKCREIFRSAGYDLDVLRGMGEF
ncbi:MAG: hypothetical protein Q7T36_07505 [Fluviicoccus sp.]|uniref:hypothetical protein n=1 Tax=Fluviicoccus sp. TaxID=2003552 RepID=UPI002726A1A0|nr:hypothetical protein [Fluviicoccus sp.]MDO8330300.1 hypothetical protein [Fluviicoccus sp.]